MGAVANGNTPATEIAFDRMTELLLAEEIEYPRELTFVPADLPEFGTVMLRALAKGRAILVIYPDGRERFIPAPTSPQSAELPPSAADRNAPAASS